MTVEMKKVLVVDDESALRECFRIFFEMEGLEVFEASNGAEALSLLAIQPVDLILTDINMPVKDGLQFIKELRKQGKTTRVVAMSGRILPGDIDLSRIGANHFIAKPIVNIEGSIQEILNGTQ